MTVGSAIARGSVGFLAFFSLAGVAAGQASGGLAKAASRPDRPLAAAARACTPPHYPSVGYFDAVTVTGTTCSVGNRLVLAFYRCRTRSGPAGRCTTAVLGFKCTEIRESIPTEVDARDTCKHGRERVVSAWQQDLS
jgi:hypothetical protein